MTDGVFSALVCSAAAAMILMCKISGGKHSIRRALLSVASGIAALGAVELASLFTGIALPVSRLSLCAAGFLGIPGVTAMLVLQALF